MCVFHRRKIDKQCPFTNWLDCFLKTQMFWWVFAFDLPTVMTWVVVWFPICPFPINQSVVFYIEISREDPTPLWPIFPDRLASKSWGLSGVFFSPWFLDQKKHAGYSPSVQKHLPKIFSTQSNPRKDPEWALRPSFPKLGRWSPPRGLLFWVEFDLGMDGNPWKPIIFPDFFGTTIHLPTIWPGYQDFDTAISRHASYLALVMDSLISPAGRRGRGKMVLFSSPFSHPQGLPSGKLT